MFAPNPVDQASLSSFVSSETIALQNTQGPFAFT